MKTKLLLLALVLTATQAAAVGSLTSIDVYDRNQQRPLPVYWHQGKAYIVGTPGNEYSISLRNQAGQDVLAVVSVDGINVVSGETAAPQQTGYVVDAGRELAVAGWRKSLSRTAAFYFTALPSSYAARTGRPQNVGVIGVALFRRRAEEPPAISAPSSSPFAAPRAEAPVGSGAAEARAPSPLQKQSEDSLGTEHGRSESSPARYTSFERATSHPEEIVTLYYDSYANLVARGIIPATPREPQPFPGRFVPDPPRW